MKRLMIHFIIFSFALLSVLSCDQSPSQTKRQTPVEPVAETKQEWTLVGKDKDETSAYYIKTNRVGRTEQKTILVWEKQTFLSSEDRGEYLVLLYEHDCTEGKSRNLEFTRYSKEGEGLLRYSREKLEEANMTKWIYVPPGTVREAILNAACKAASSHN